MKKILDNIDVRTLPNGKQYLLLDDFKYHVGDVHSKDILIVKAGFVTDFASVPRFAWSIVPPTGRIKPAALVHDWLYKYKGNPPTGQKYSRKQCDKIFLEIMHLVGMPWHEKQLAYRAVRMFGRFAWNKTFKNLNFLKV